LPDSRLRDLREDVDAVPVLVDHLRDAAAWLSMRCGELAGEQMEKHLQSRGFMNRVMGQLTSVLAG
jgi:high-affinity nickel permease